MQKLCYKTGLVEAPWPGAADKSELVSCEALSLHFWNYCGVLQDMPFKQLTHFADPYR